MKPPEQGVWRFSGITDYSTVSQVLISYCDPYRFSRCLEFVSPLVSEADLADELSRADESEGSFQGRGSCLQDIGLLALHRCLCVCLHQQGVGGNCNEAIDVRPHVTAGPHTLVTARPTSWHTPGSNAHLDTFQISLQPTQGTVLGPAT